MCKIDAPKPQKAPPPPKLGLEAPELVEEKVTDVDENGKAKATGLDQLRIDLTAPSQTVAKGGSGIQL